jgi:RNA polymerase sigma-70 factor (ECF subfamily)
VTDREEFDELYRSFAPLGLHVARRVLGDAAAAEEVVQDLFLALWRNPRSFDPRRGPLKSYVAMVARSRSIDRWRRRAAERAAQERLAVESRVLQRTSVDGADQSVLEEERRGEVLSAVAKLPEEQRDALLLAFRDGLTAREIAACSGLPLGTAKSRIRLGLARTREHLEDAA